jgi:hypothetical protein
MGKAMGERLPNWVAPTRRAVPWTPLAAATVSLVVVACVARVGTARAPLELLNLACGAFVAAIAFALDDTAHALVQPLPVSARSRLAHRMVLLLPVSAIAGGFLLIVGRLVFDEVPSQRPPFAAPAALLGAAIAMRVWWSRRRPDHAAEAGAAVAIGWPAFRAVVPADLFPDWMTSAWIIHPWPVLGVAITLIVIGTGGITS